MPTIRGFFGGIVMNKGAKRIALIGILSGLAFIVMLIEIPFPLATWLKFDLSESVVLYGMLVGGPVAGAAIGLLKCVLKFLISGSSSLGVGEVAAFVAALAFSLPAYFFYKLKKNMLLGLIVGTLVLTVVLTAANYFYITPYYAKLYKMDFIMDMMNAHDGTYFKYIVYTYGLFNLTKGGVITVVYTIVDKYLKRTYNV